MGNVVEFKLKTGYDHIQFFLDGLETSSTRTNYEDSIKKFLIGSGIFRCNMYNRTISIQ